MEWYTLDRTVRGSGRLDVYLIAVDEHRACAYLTRFRTEYRGPGRHGREADAFEVAEQAARNRIETICQRGPGRPPLAVELDAAVVHLVELAERYESGEPVTGHPGWEHPAPVPVPHLADDDSEAHADAARDRAGYTGPGPWVAPVETGEPFRSAAERERDASRGD